jgi:hypothetical protein
VRCGLQRKELKQHSIIGLGMEISYRFNTIGKIDLSTRIKGVTSVFLLLILFRAKQE